MKAIEKAVDKYRQLILDAERHIWKTPETGFKEVKTSAYLENEMEKLGYNLIKAGDIPGFYTVIDTGKPGPEVLVLGELDSVICSAHPECNKETGAVHACAHNTQTATLLGIGAILKEPGVLDGLCGKIRLCFVPAEELLEIEYRLDLRKKGVIKYLGGKAEFLHRGYFDGVDMAFMVHASNAFSVRRGSVGAISKNVIYKGKSSHAGGSPQNGINALYAASLGLNAINAIRETFVEKDILRVHPIITHGGDMVNAIPHEVKLESYVRGKTFDAIVKENKKINRALIGSALSIGANIEIIDMPAFAPLLNDTGMMELAKDAAEIAIPEETLNYDPIAIGSGSTDMGDLSCIMPVVHPYAGGRIGASHGADSYISEPERACVKSAKWQVTMLKLLLENGAERAKTILKNFTPLFKSKEEFLAFQDSLNSSGDRIKYLDNGTAEIKL
ncbi:MAG: amidohydrolase [Clostridia bacterium]|nr:amidohydrolase [Clostridia bacterium]